MKLIATLVLAPLFISCGQADTSEYDTTYLSALSILEPGVAPPPNCTQLGVIHIPEREPGFASRLSGYAAQEFHQSLQAQVSSLGVNLLVPSEGTSLAAAASSGEPFHAVAYACP